MRLIDADALIPMMKYTTTDNEIGVFPIRIGFDAIKGVIDDAPTIDAVQVVRCRECKWHRSGQNEVDTWSICIEPTLRAAHVQDDDYCSWGERKEATDDNH